MKLKTQHWFIIVIGVLLITLLMSSVKAEPDEKQITPDLGVSVNTSENLEATFIETSEGDISNTIHCNAQGDCQNTIYGNVNVADNQTISLTQVSNHYSDSNGFSMTKFTNSLNKETQNYLNGERNKFSLSNLFLQILDAVFVSEKQYATTINNQNFLADKIDRLEAENQYWKEMLLGEYTETETATIECYTAINRAKRTDGHATTNDGRIVDLVDFGEECMVIR
jgi:hypothetical protein